MEEKFDLEYILNKLKKYDSTQNIAFGLSCCERLYRNYCRFYEESDWGNPALLREALDFLWDGLQKNAYNYKVLTEYITAIDTVTPNIDDGFESIFDSPALDASSSIKMLFEYLVHEDSAFIANIAALCRDTVDMHIQLIAEMNPNAINFEHMITVHPLMQRELKRQRIDFEFLDAQIMDIDRCNLAKKMWYNPEKSNLDV